jgi:hypothetical protein
MVQVLRNAAMETRRVVIVRRNNFILGSGASAVKGILVRCTSRRQPHRRKPSKCNKIKHLEDRPEAGSKRRTKPI